MIQDRTWTQFIKAKENKDLTLAEQKRKYSDERKRLEIERAFINSGILAWPFDCYITNKKNKTFKHSVSG